MEDLNKITSTRVGDNIHFFVNGAEDSGTVVKMNTSFVTVVKDDGILQDIHINDTFFIKDILVNKTWNDMSMEERTVALHEIHAYSPRFLAKSWQELPRELKEVLENTAKSDDDYSSHTWSEGYKDGKDAGKKQRNTQMEATAPQITNTLAHNVLNNMKYRDDKDKRKLDGLKKSNVEDSHLGSAGRASHVIETNMDIDATEDYEGQTEDEKKEQFKHEEKKPETTDKSMQEQIWEEWLDKGDMGGDSAPAQTSMVTGTTGVYNARYGSDGRIIGQGKDKDEEDKDDKKEEKKG